MRSALRRPLSGQKRTLRRNLTWPRYPDRIGVIRTLCYPEFPESLIIMNICRAPNVRASIAVLISALLYAYPSRAEEETTPYVYGVVEQLANKTHFGTRGRPDCDPNRLCYVNAPYGYLYAVVHVHTNFYFPRVMVPNEGVRHGDIIKLRPAPKGSRAYPEFVEVARAKSARGDGCDWVDGDPAKFTGGVACAGWTYRE